MSQLPLPASSRDARAGRSAPGPGPGDAVGPYERDAEACLVREAVARLPERQRATLILKIYHELTHEEVAEILGSSVGTVKANLFHALANLRRLMAVPLEPERAGGSGR